MAALSRSDSSSGDGDSSAPEAAEFERRDRDREHHERDKRRLQDQQEQYQQLQRDLADAISRLASLDDIRILLACGAKANNVVTQGLRPLHYAAYTNFVPAVRLLLLRGSDINATDDNGYTAVHLCAERGYKELLEFLIENGARVCFTDMRGGGAGAGGGAASGSPVPKGALGSPSSHLSPIADEPLSMALKRGHLPCAEVLLKAGADPNAEYFMGREINLVNILDWRSISLLLRYGAQPDARDRSGLTPLMKAARHPQGLTTVKLLLDYGADPNDIAGERHDYRTVLHHSIFSGNAELVRLLLTRGARYPALQFDKPSPLDIAMISGRSDLVRLLIEFDADVNAGAQSTIGQPLHTALTQRIENKREIVRMLLDAGADPNSPKTSNRASGPVLADYLCAARHCAGGGGGAHRAHPPAGQNQQFQNQHNRENAQNQLHAAAANNNNNNNLGPDPEIVRLLLRYGARVLLKTASQTPLGIVRVLERIQDELSPELLCLLIDSAEQIDWFMMSKIIYTFLRSANRSRSNELFDPSVAADMTPARLAALLAPNGPEGEEPAEPEARAAAGASAGLEVRGRRARYHDGLPDELVRLMNAGRGPSSVLSLKQLARLGVRAHLAERLGARGRSLVRRLGALPLPRALVSYLLYESSTCNAL